MAIQLISVEVARRLVNKLVEIKETGVLDNVFLDPDGYGMTVIPRYIESLESGISNARLLNEITGSSEFKVGFDDRNNGYMITKVIKEYQKRVIQTIPKEAVDEVTAAVAKSMNDPFWKVNLDNV